MKKISLKKILTMIILMTFLTQMVGKKSRKSNFRYNGLRDTNDRKTRTVCMDIQNTLRARHKTCFLRPDTGPCRADLIQWYYDVKQKKCYRFFWGGCQGNGNRFETKHECYSYCFLNLTAPDQRTPYFCDLSFDYGTCFGQYNRWSWDKFSKTCKLRLYSGCGGNQNNFESRGECMHACLTAPNITLRKQERTTCFPMDIGAIHNI